MRRLGENTWTSGACTEQINLPCYRMHVWVTVYRRNQRPLVCVTAKPRDETSRDDATSPPELFERLILNRVVPFVDEHLIPEQACFRPGMSCSSQLLNLTQIIGDGYAERLITGVAFVDICT